MPPRAPITDAIRLFAELPEEHLPELSEPSQRIRTPSFTLLVTPSGLSYVINVRASESSLDETIAEARRLVTEVGCTRAAWRIGPSCRPERLGALLAARGFVPSTRPPLEPTTTAMALVTPPAPCDLEARRVRDFPEYLAALRIAVETFEQSEEDAAGWLAAAPVLWKQQDFVTQFVHVAILDGQPVGFAFAAAGTCGLFLCGSGVLSGKRGRGAYRALVAARWAEAVAAGKPALVVQAGSMSLGILERAGFEAVCGIEVLDNPAFLAGA